MNKWQKHVKSFMEACDFDTSDSPGEWAGGEDRISLCLALIKEEWNELQEAVQNNDPVETIDASVDLLYVTLFLVNSIGIDLEQYWDEVHRTNMEKACAPKDSVTGKQTKPVDWKPPRIAELLRLDRVEKGLDEIYNYEKDEDA